MAARLEQKLRDLIQERLMTRTDWTKAQCIEWLDIYEKEYFPVADVENTMYHSTPLGSYYVAMLKQYVDLDRRELAASQAQSATD